ncbi:MAG: M48 family metalloprotease, partial [Myxococcota bacterium]
MKALCALSLSVLSQSGCAINPATQEPVLLALSEQQELDLGEAGLAVLSVTPGLWSDEPLLRLVRRVGATLGTIAPGPPTHYRFYILDTDQKNAFALPGGYVFISRGLLAILEREDELAAVLAHEIGHVAARHASRRATVNQGYEFLQGIAAAFSSLFNVDIRDSERFFASVLASHSRGQEREADRIGVVLAVSSGYEGTALADVLIRLEQERVRGDEILNTHPSTPERRALIDTLASNLVPGPGSPELSVGSFLRHLDGLPLGPGRALGVVD